MTYCDLCIGDECNDPRCRGGRNCQAALCMPALPAHSSCDVCGATDRPTATVIAYGIETNACDRCRGVEDAG